MSNPSWVTQQNVKFNGTLDNAVVLKNSGGVKSLILWDALSAADQQILIDLVNNYGGTTPMSGASAGFQTINFNGLATGGTSTGLSSVSAATAGKATINVGGAKITTSPSGLSSSAGTHGSQSVLFSTALTNGLSTGLTLTAGYQYINFSALTAGSDATNLVSGTTYTSTITIDGVAKSISILGSAAATFTTLVSEINADLGAAGTATLDVTNKRIVITSATTGSASSVLAVQGTLFASPLSNFTSISAAVAGTGSTAALTATIVVDGVNKAVSLLPANIQTFGAVITGLNTALGVAGTATLSGNDIVITSATYGTSSTVAITAGTLFPALANFTQTLPAQSGGGAARSYSATVIIDGTIFKTISFNGLAGDTFAHVISEINTDLGASATAALTAGNIVITSATTGANSSVVIQDSGFLCSSLSGYVGISSVNGVAPTTYTATVKVDGVDIGLSIAGNNAQTYTTLVSAINTGLGSAATAAIVTGNIVITSATTGTSSSVSITDGTLFKALTVFKNFATGVTGASDLLAVFNNARSPNGSLYSNIFNVIKVGAKPPVPPAMKHGLSSTYWNGTVWKYLDTDATV